MPSAHFHLTGMEILKWVSILIIVNFLSKPLVAHYRSSPWAQGLGWVLD
jgi:hypothetical protein